MDAKFGSEPEDKPVEAPRVCGRRSPIHDRSTWLPLLAWPSVSGTRQKL